MSRFRSSKYKSKLRDRLLAKYGPACMWCSRETSLSVDPSNDLFTTIEHVIRLCDGGKSNMKNCRIACRSCNNERMSGEPPAYRKYPKSKSNEIMHSLGLFI